MTERRSILDRLEWLGDNIPISWLIIYVGIVFVAGIFVFAFNPCEIGACPQNTAVIVYTCSLLISILFVVLFICRKIKS